MSTNYVFSLYKVQTGKAHLTLLEVRTEVSLGDAGSTCWGARAASGVCVGVGVSVT